VRFYYEPPLVPEALDAVLGHGEHELPNIARHAVVGRVERCAAQRLGEAVSQAYDKVLARERRVVDNALHALACRPQPGRLGRRSVVFLRAKEAAMALRLRIAQPFEASGAALLAAAEGRRGLAQRFVLIGPEKCIVLACVWLVHILWHAGKRRRMAPHYTRMHSMGCRRRRRE
jgi:hypothetical protein